jgi:hypothetical protein
VTDDLADLFERAAATVADYATPPPVERIRATAARRAARARALALAATLVLLLAAGAVLVPLSGSPHREDGDHVTATSPATAPRVAVLTTESPPPPALLAESASIRWQARSAAADVPERSPRRDKI